MDTLGIPSGKFTLDDQEVYVWSTSHLEGSGFSSGGWAHRPCPIIRA